MILIIVSKYVEIEIIHRNKNRYKNLGYEDFKVGDIIKIHYSHAPINSKAKILIQCDYCQIQYETTFLNLSRYDKNIDRKHACKSCRLKASNATNKNKTDEEKQLMKDNFLKSCIKKYGTDNPMKVDIFKEKCLKSGFLSQKFPASKMQKHIFDLYNANFLNYPFKKYCADMYFENEKIYLEYDGSGHRLQVHWGKISNSEFDAKEEKRREYFKSLGLKEFRIISSTDKINDDTLNMIKKDAFYHLVDLNYNHYIYDVEKNESIFYF